MKNKKYLSAIWGFIPVIIFLSLWEIIARIKIIAGRVYLPPFSLVVTQLYQLTLNGTLGFHFMKSLTRLLFGFLGGSLAGLLMGVLMGWYKLINKALNPIINLLYPIPALGWLPILMLWLGIGEILPILLIFLSSFFPVLYNTVTGIKNVGQEYIDDAKILGASNRDILLLVVIPLSLPNIFTGLKLGSGVAWRVIIAAEMVAIPTGIGALMMKAEGLMRLDIIIVCLMVLTVMCFLFERILSFLEKRFNKF